MVFTGSFSFSQVASLSQINCVLGNSTLAATNWTDGSVSCVTTVAPVGVVQAYITVNGVVYTNSIPFTFYGKLHMTAIISWLMLSSLDCAAITTGCSDCLAPLNTRCRWCSRYCAFTCDSSDFQQIQCPCKSRQRFRGAATNDFLSSEQRHTKLRILRGRRNHSD